MLPRPAAGTAENINLFVATIGKVCHQADWIPAGSRHRRKAGSQARRCNDAKCQVLFAQRMWIERIGKEEKKEEDFAEKSSGDKARQRQPVVRFNQVAVQYVFQTMMDITGGKYVPNEYIMPCKRTA